MKSYPKWLPILLILLLAFALRLYALTEVPPGLTHDEANHGREAIGILQGMTLFFFPLNYGSEPLYSYTVAGSMWLLGESLFALRLVNVLFSVATIGLTYLWVQRRFDQTTALLTAVLLTIILLTRAYFFASLQSWRWQVRLIAFGILLISVSPWA